MGIEVTQQPFDLQMEVYDLQTDPSLSIKKESPEDFWKILSQEKFSKLRNFSLQTLLLFVSTYVCEAAFFTMNVIKSRMRNSLDNFFS
jgi:hypothetical protein